MEESEERIYTLAHRRVAGVPLLELYTDEGREDAGAMPLLVIFHGYGSRKERKLQHAYMAAEAGFFVLLPDAARHGERSDAEFEALSEEEGATLLVRIVRQSAEDLRGITEAYRQDERTLNEGISLLGTSMGGMIVYEYLRRWGAEEIASAVPIISTPAWTEMTEYIRRNEPRFDEVFSPELEQEVKEADPAEELLKLRDVPICMLNAVEDELMPIESVRRFYGRLKQNYSDASLLRLVTYPGHGHMTSEAMMKESVAWAKAHRPAANR